MADTPVLVTPTRLRDFIVDALAAMKMPRPAEITADLMVRTDLRGVDSHGIGVLPRYHELWQAGYISMDAEPTVVRDDMATGLFDGQKGLGHHVSTLAMRRCIEKARTCGVGMVAVRNSGHYGAAANYSMMATRSSLSPHRDRHCALKHGLRGSPAPPALARHSRPMPAPTVSFERSRGPGRR